MSNALTVRPENPANIGYPPTLPIEVALRVAPIKEICEAYGLTREDWDNLRQDPVFVADLSAVAAELKKDGMSFKMKAKLQSESLLQRSWQLIHASTDEVAPSVQADLIKATWRVAGLEPSKTAADAGQQNALQININLG